MLYGGFCGCSKYEANRFCCACCTCAGCRAATDYGDGNGYEDNAGSDKNVLKNARVGIIGEIFKFLNNGISITAVGKDVSFSFKRIVDF